MTTKTIIFTISLLCASMFHHANANTAKVNLKAVTEKDIECLTKNAYFEANGEGLRGIDAVNLVVFNRLKHESFPKTVCGIIAQKAQFSWLWDGRKNQIKDKKTYTLLKKSIGRFVVAYNRGQIKDFTNGAIFYNNPRLSKSKRFFRRLVVTYRSGNHVFYKPKRGIA